MQRKILAPFFAIAIFFLLSSISFAKTINLYEEPKADSKLVGTVDPSTGIIPIYTPKEGTWVKVGNPKNGNVGWVKSSDLADAGASSSGFSFSQQVEKSGNGPETYVFKLGIPTALTKEQSDALYKQIQAQQAAIQQSVQKIIKDMFNSYNQTMAPAATTPTPANPKK